MQNKIHNSWKRLSGLILIIGAILLFFTSVSALGGLVNKGRGEVTFSLPQADGTRSQENIAGKYTVEFVSKNNSHESFVKDIGESNTQMSIPEGTYEVYVQDPGTGIILRQEGTYDIQKEQASNISLPEMSIFVEKFDKSISSLKSKVSEAGEDVRNWEYVPDEILIKFKPGITLKIIHKTIKSANASIRKYYKNIDVYRVEIPADKPISETLNLFEKNANVEYAEKSAIPKVSSTTPTDWAQADPDFYWAWHELNDRDIDAPEAWDYETGSSSVIVAVLDTGIDTTHDDLQNKLWVNDDPPGDSNSDGDHDDDQNGFVDDLNGWYFNNLGFDSPDVTDTNGHGTHVSGIIGAEANNGILDLSAGTCWNCKIMTLKLDLTVGDYWLTGIAEVSSAIHYATDNGASVINMSWHEPSSSTTLRNAIIYAYNSGVALVGAAGNGGSDQIGDPQINFPASMSQVMAVGNLERTVYNNNPVLGIHESSNYEDKINLVAAPGTNIYSTIPPNDYDYMSGTSMASPMAAGVAGLVISKAEKLGKNLDPSSVYSILKFSADYIPDPNWDGTDDSLPGNDPARNEYVGYGKVNAHKAVHALISPTTNITSPTGSPVSGNVNVTATATDANEIKKVEFYIDGIFKAEDTTAPYEYSWDTTTETNAAHSIKAIAYDTFSNFPFGEKGEDLIYITVDNTVPTYSISGYVRDTLSQGIDLVWVSSGATGDYTNSSGYYEITGLVPGTYNVTPTKQNYTFNPSSSQETIISANQVANFTGTEYQANDTFTFFATEDTYIQESDASNTHNTGCIRAGKDYYGGTYQNVAGLMKFADLSTSPDIQGKRVYNAELKLRLSSTNGPDTILRVWEIGKYEGIWDEGETYNSFPYESFAWYDNLGAMRGSVNFDADNADVGTWLNLINIKFEDYVQGIIDGTDPNYGLLIDGHYGDIDAFPCFSSSETSYPPQLTVTVLTGTPDLVVNNVSTNPMPGEGNTFNINQSVTIDYSVFNNGPGGADYTRAAIYLGNSAADFSFKLDDISSGQLLAGEQDDDSINYTFTSGDVGTKYILVKADFEGSVSETNEGNNVSWFGPVTIMQPNQAPTISGLPDKSLNEDQSLDNTIDLWSFANDAETADSALNFAINNSPDVNANVTLDSNRYIDINPYSNWCGSTIVEIKVTDPEGLNSTDVFSVTVNCVNDLPWISPTIPGQTAYMNENIVIDLTLYEHDVEDSGINLDWYVTGLDSASVSGEYSDNDQLTFTPNIDFIGNDTVTLHLIDSGTQETTQGITLTWEAIPQIEGTVYESGGVTPIIGGSVRIYVYTGDPCNSYQYVTSVLTDSADGTYTIAEQNDGSYYLYANTYNLNYVNEWWNGSEPDPSSADCSLAQSVTISSGSTFSGINFELEPGAVISGTVFEPDNTTAIINTSIYIHAYLGDPCDTSNSPVASTSINTIDGTYNLEGLAAGTYYLHVNSPSDINYMNEWWTGGNPDPSAQDCSLAQTITVSTGATSTGNNFALDLGVGISGTVFESDNITLITGVSVLIYIYSGDPCGSHNFISSLWTDPSDGTYQIGKLEDGSYYLFANNNEMNSINYVNEWWNGSSPDPSDKDCSLAQPITGTAGDIFSGTDFALDPGATISGTLFESNGIDLIIGSNLVVTVYTGDPCSQYNHVTSRMINTSDGTYQIAGLPSGTYYFRSDNNRTNYLNEWWNGGSPDPSSVDCSLAQTVTLSTGGTMPGINFALDQGATITGTIYESDGTTPVTGTNLGINIITGNPCGSYQSSYGTDINTADGTFEIIGLSSGTYYLRINNYISDYVEEWWNGGSPDPSSYDCSLAQQVSVTAGNTSSGKNFHLDQGGSISGTVYQSDGVTAITDYLEIQVITGDPCGPYQSNFGSENSSVDGKFEIAGLAPGNYYLRIWNNGPAYYVNEWWNGGSPDPSDFACNLAQEVTVAAGSTATGINFELDIGGSVSGTVYHSDGTTRITNGPINVALFSGDPCNSYEHISGRWTDTNNGTYSISGVPSGNYYVRAENVQGYGTNYITEWWSGGNPDPSSYDCNLSQQISILAGNTMSGKDFALDEGGTISGTVYENDGVTPVTGISLAAELFTGTNACNVQWVRTVSTNSSDGTYSMSGIVPGNNYYMMLYNEGSSYITEWWNGNDPDPSDPDCNLASSINVSAGSTILGIDFELDQGGSISGTVYESNGTTPITGVPKDIVAYTGDPCGQTQFVMGRWTDTSDGKYRLDGLLPGNYYIHAHDANGHPTSYLQEWWNGGSPDPSDPDCSLAQQVTVTVGNTTAGINFALDLGGAISGTIFESDGITPITGVSISIDATISPIGNICNWSRTKKSANTNPGDGTYEITGLEPGNYYIRIWNNGSTTYVNEWWNGGSPDPSDFDCGLAQEITVTGGNTATGINFHLDNGGNISGTVYESNGTTPITAGPINVALFSGNPCSSNQHIIGRWTDSSNGTYQIAGIPIGSYYARAENVQGYGTNYITEWWNGSSPDPSSNDCSLAQMLTITTGSITSGTTFALDKGGAISGTVFENDGTTAVTGLSLAAELFTGMNGCNVQWVKTVSTNSSDGTYSISGIVPGNNYYMMMYNAGSNYTTEWWNGSDPDPSDPDCALALPINVVAGSTISGINFELDQGGSISGTVHDAGGTPITGQSLSIGVYTSSDPCGPVSRIVRLDINTSDGTYLFTGLEPGSYYLKMDNSYGSNYVQEWWNGGNPDPSDYDCSLAQQVNVTSGNTIGGVDFDLDIGGIITGTIFQSDGVTPITGDSIGVYVFDEQSTNPCSNWSSNLGAQTNASNGTYQLSGIPEGNHYLRVEVPSGVNYIEEWWNGDSQDPSSHDCSLAQTVTVTSGNTTPDVNFELQEGGAISGTIYQADGTTPITGNSVRITAYDVSVDPCYNTALTSSSASINSNSENGTYSLSGLLPGTYYLRTYHNGTNYVREWWNGGVPDPSSYDCTIAQAITVTTGDTVSGINFELDTGESISGSMYKSDGVTLITDAWEAAMVYFGDPCGDHYEVTHLWTNTGNYTLTAVPAGNYFIRSLNWEGSQPHYANEWWNGSSPDPSSYDCSLAQTTLVTIGSPVTGKDFSLELNQSPSIQFVEPNGSGDFANTSFEIKWLDSDPDNDAIINLYYDTDNSGEDGTLILGEISEDDLSDSYVWDTSAISEGSYYTYAVISDGINPSVTVYSTYPVIVTRLGICPTSLCNGDFESANDLEFWATGNGTNQIVTDVVQDGTKAYYTEHLHDTSVSPRWSGIWQNIVVESAQTYGLTGFYQSQNAAQGHIKISWKNITGTLLQVDYPVTNINGTNSNWIEFSKLVIAPAGAYSAEIRIWHGVNTLVQNQLGSKLWIDSLAFDVATTACGTLCNESFEHGILYWIQSGAVGSHTIDQSDTHEGLKALKSEQLYSSGEETKWAGVSQFAQVKEGTTYRLRVWIKTENTVNGHIRIRWRDDSGSLISTQYPVTGITGTNTVWFKREANITAPANAARAETTIWHGVTTENVPGSTLWVDDITLICLSLCNGGFEDGNVHWETNGINEGEPVTVNVQEGAKAVKIVQSLDGTLNTQWAGISQRTLVTGGNSYNLSFWIKKENTVQGHVKIKWRDNNDQLISQQFPIGGINGTNLTWTQMSTTLTAPANAETVEIFIWHGVDGTNQNAAGSTLYLDNITFAQTT